MATAAERKRRQRERDTTTICDLPDDKWTERHCLAVLADPRWRKGSQAVAKGAWKQLGKLRGWV